MANNKGTGPLRETIIQLYKKADTQEIDIINMAITLITSSEDLMKIFTIAIKAYILFTEANLLPFEPHERDMLRFRIRTIDPTLRSDQINSILTRIEKFAPEIIEIVNRHTNEGQLNVGEILRDYWLDHGIDLVTEQ